MMISYTTVGASNMDAPKGYLVETSAKGIF